VRAFFLIVLQPKQQAPDMKDKVQTIPNPNKSEYSGMRHSMNAWAEHSLEPVDEQTKVGVELIIFY